MLSDYLKKHNASEGLSNILLLLASLFPKVAETLRTGSEGYAGGQNVFGEKQLKLDVYTNDIFANALKANKYVSVIASEELSGEEKGLDVENGYAVAFDPLDGSSLVDVNLAVGSIFGFYRGNSFIGQKGKDQVAAMVVIYGPRLTMMLSIGQGVAEFRYDPKKKDFSSVGTEHCSVPTDETKKMFAPGNLKACNSEKWYLGLLEYWVKNGYTLRYSGGMAPDVNQILKQGGGIFTYPGSKEMPDGKLRLLFECAPVAFLMEQAGGTASTGHERILDIIVKKTDQRTPIFAGSKKEVEIALKYFK